MADESINRTIDDVLEKLKNCIENGKKCSLLIGAGCSLSAGIPLASGFVDEIKKRHGQDYKRAQKKTYPYCMAELSLGFRQDLIAEYVDKAKLNWAHIGIAQLIAEGYVDRVLTTNFDPLVSRACARVGEFPAIYDFAASQVFKPALLPQKAIFHLHGQRSSFVALHTQEQIEKHGKLLKPVFTDAGQGRMWIVVGYSGQNDPVLNHLAKVSNFEYCLYWVDILEEPRQDLREKLFTPDKFAFYVGGQDADDFFVELTQKLNIFPPSYVGQPFTHLDQQLSTLTPYSLPGEKAKIDIAASARALVREAIERYEKRIIPEEKVPPETAPTLEAEALLAAGKYGDVIAMRQSLNVKKNSAHTVLLSWAYVMEGNSLSEQARTKSGAMADRLFKQAGEKYAAALKINPDKHETLYNWGHMLSAQALSKSGAVADRLFREAEEKYAAALQIKPDLHNAFNNWGNALSARTRTQTGAAANRLWKQAGAKYAAALKIKPDLHAAFNNWGAALSDQACTKSGAAADRLFRQAGEKYAAALKIKPDDHEVLYNWGIALSGHAHRKTGAAAVRLFKQAAEKFAGATKFKPDFHDALYTWGNVLAGQVGAKTGAAADRLFKQAGEKYAAALKIKPDSHEALSNWGIVLSSQARIKSGPTADRLFKRAGEKYAAALKIKPNNHEALYNWGNGLLAQADTKTGAAAERLFKQAGEKFAAALKIKPDMHEGLNNWGNALLAQARTKSGAAANRLFKQAEEKYAAALKINPDDPKVLDYLGSVYLFWSRIKQGTVAKRLYASAEKKLLKAEEISKGAASYNLACLAALRGDVKQCREWLYRAHRKGTLPKRKHLETDSDMDRVRNLKWFKALLAKI